MRARSSVLLLLLVSSPALARTIDVDPWGSGDYTSIQDAIDAAVDGDEVEVQPATYTEIIDFGGKAITVRGVSGSASTILDGAGAAAYVVTFDGGEDETSVLEGFTIRNATEQGLYINASPTLTDLAFEAMGGTSDSGGCVAVLSGSPSFDTVSFTDCVAFKGASLYVASGDVTLNNATFSGGYGSVSGGAWIGAGTLTITDSSFDDNTSAGNGGAIYLKADTSLNLSNVDFSDNTTEAGHGGAIYANDGNIVTISGGTFSGNTPEDYEDGYHGGAIAMSYGTLNISGTTFDTNFGYYGGALYTTGSTVTLDSAVFSGNYAYYGGAGFIYGPGTYTDTTSLYDANTSYYYGGALYVYYDVDEVFTGTEFTENVAYYGYGGAIYASYYGSMLFDGVDLNENSAYYYGGAVYAYYQTDGMIVRNSLITDNEAQNGYGGGIYSYITPLVVEVSEFSWNQAYYSGGGIYQYYGAELALNDSTFDHNTATYYSGGGVYYWPYNTGYNLNALACTFSDNTSRYEGGGLYGLSAEAVQISGTRFWGNELEDASYGGGLYLKSAASLNLDNVEFVQNEAEMGGGAYLEELSAETGVANIENSVFQENQGVRYGGGLLTVEIPQLAMVNNTLVGNIAGDAGGAVYLYNTVLDFRNNIVAWTIDGAALYFDGADQLASTTVSYNNFWENAAGHAGGLFTDDDLGARANLEEDPELIAYSLDGDPDNDNYALAATSPCIDAGDPELFDADGTRSDIGAFGGDNAILVDEDADGYTNNLDCDDTDAAVYPGAADTWYDGVNTDCGTTSDYDADGDGYDSESYGGDDCDDSDAATWVDCVEPDTASEDTAADTAAPQDSAEPTDDSAATDTGEAKPTTCGCASAPGRASGLGLSALLALVLVRRRR